MAAPEATPDAALPDAWVWDMLLRARLSTIYYTKLERKRSRVEWLGDGVVVAVIVALVVATGEYPHAVFEMAGGALISLVVGLKSVSTAAKKVEMARAMYERWSDFFVDVERFWKRFRLVPRATSEMSQEFAGFEERWKGLEARDSSAIDEKLLSEAERQLAKQYPLSGWPKGTR